MATYGGIRPNSGSGDLSLDGGKVSYEYIVYASSFAEDAITIANTSGLPGWFDTHPDNVLYRVRNIKPVRQGNSKVWYVTVEYSTPDKNNNQTSQENEDPVNDIAEISIDYEEHDEPIEHLIDTDGTTDDPASIMFKASNGQLFSPQPKKKMSIPSMTITQNYGYTYASAALAAAFGVVNKINSSSFLGADAKTLKCVNIKPVSEVRTVGSTKIPFLRITFTFKYNRETWNLKLLDRGTFYNEYVIDPPGTGTGVFKKTTFKSDDGFKMDKGLLNGAGGKLPDGDSPIYLPTTGQWQTYPCADFDSLGLPLSLGGYKFV